MDYLIFWKIRYEIDEKKKTESPCLNRVRQVPEYALEIILSVNRKSQLPSRSIKCQSNAQRNSGSFEGYLNSIAQNLESDLKKAKKINETRGAFPKSRTVPRPDRSRLTSNAIRKLWARTLGQDQRYSLGKLGFHVPIPSIMATTKIYAWPLISAIWILEELST